MLRWALIFFIISLIAGFFGFSGVSAATATIAKVLFFGFIVVAAVLLVAGVVIGRKALNK